MPITFECPCGTQLRVADEFAGRQAKCPSCEAVVPVPVGHVGEPDEPPRRAAVARRVPDRDEADEIDRPRRRDDDDRPRFGKRRLTDDGSARDWKSKDDTGGTSRGPDGKGSNGGVIGGVVAMVIAVVWFVVGLAFFDRLFFYPPVLFVIGLVGFIRGLVEYSNRAE